MLQICDKTSLKGRFHNSPFSPILNYKMKSAAICAFVLCLVLCSQVDGKPSQCYHAQDSTALSIEKCGLLYDVCISSHFVVAELGIINRQKNCNTRTSLLEQNCVSINVLYGGNCYICDTDLCNEAW
jgi:hypothetical protein